MTDINTLEKILEQKYHGKMVKYERIGLPVVYGRVQSIGTESWKKPPIVVINIDGVRYTEEMDDFESLLTLL